VRRRIVALAVAAAALATTVFGVPLGYGIAQYFLGDERNELERVADVAAISVTFDLAAGQVPTGLASPEGDITIGFYDQDGALTTGAGPVGMDATAVAALRGGQVASANDIAGQQVVAVPVADGSRVAGVVRAASDYSGVRLRIAGAWATMLALGLIAIGATWLLAQRQARRLARPLEALVATAQRLGDGDFATRTERSGIPELDAAGRALDTTAERLGALVDRERAFSADASHQLRTPLTGLRLGLETALDRPAAEQRAAMEAALDATDRLEQTITDLLALARESGPHGRPLDIPDLVADVRAVWGPMLAQRDRRLVVDVEPGLPATEVAAASVRQVIGVLLDNATVHGAGTVSLTVRDAGEALALDVADEGPGVADVDRLFTRGASRDDGHGIGLSLARTLAEAEGGRLRLRQPAPPVFSLLLPAGVPTSRPPEGREPEERPSTAPTTRTPGSR
jgi:signal transduction histidine kinase